MNSNTNVETKKKVFRFISSVVLVVVLATLFGVMWYLRLQNLMNANRFEGKGNYVMIALYMVLSVLVINTFNGFEFGSARISILTMSQAIAVGVVNAMEYVIVILMIRILKHVWRTLGYFAALTLAQAVAVLVITYISTKLYRRLFPPFSILNIYGDYENDLVTKMNRRDDKYSIDGEISCREPHEKIVEELRKERATV